MSEQESWFWLGIRYGQHMQQAVQSMDAIECSLAQETLHNPNVRAAMIQTSLENAEMTLHAAKDWLQESTLKDLRGQIQAARERLQKLKTTT